MLFRFGIWFIYIPDTGYVYMNIFRRIILNEYATREQLLECEDEPQIKCTLSYLVVIEKG